MHALVLEFHYVYLLRQGDYPRDPKDPPSNIFLPTKRMDSVVLVAGSEVATHIFFDQ